MNENLKEIHKASMKILEETGVRFHHPQIIELLKDHGIRFEGDVAYFNEEQLMYWVKKAPCQFTLYARNPKYNMRLGGNNAEFMASYGAPTIIEPNGNRRLAYFTDYLKLLKLVQMSDIFKINGGILVQPSDLTEANYPLMMYATLLHSDKCLMGGTGGAKETEIIFDMLKIIFGDKENLIQRPRIMTIINPSSPLQYDHTMLETMILYAEYGQPIIVAPAVMAGATGPITLAGTIALSSAESLAGIAVMQMLRQGTPVLYGSASSSTDMRTASFSIGSPESALCIKYCANLARFYGLPSRGAGTFNDAKSVSVQSGYEGMMNLLVGNYEGINFLLHSAGVLDSYSSMSFEQFIVDLEMLSSVQRFMKDVNFDEDSFALNVINKVGPGGNFISEEHTFLNCRKEFWLPRISLRGMIQEEPDQLLMNKIENRLEQILCNYEFPPFERETKERLCSYLKGIGFIPSEYFRL